MWLSEVLQEAISDLFASRKRPAPPPPLPPRPATPAHLTDEALNELLSGIEGIQVQQSELLLELAADVLSGLAVAADEAAKEEPHP